jgi:uncharacterized protein (DUF1810 family)
MSSKGTPDDANDPFGLIRFLEAQQDDYASILAEIRGGQKRSHWMWYVFPQLDGLANSAMSKHYAIKGVDEARAYLAHPILGTRLTECANALFRLDGRSIEEIMGSPDDLKLQSCATLFATVSEPSSVFQRILEKYYQGERDEKTIRILGLCQNERH